MNAFAWIALAVVLTATSVGARAQDQTPPQAQTPVQSGANVTVTISAAEMEIIDNAVHGLKGNDDPFVATTVANNILKVANAMVASGRTYQIGPLTNQEQTVIDLDALIHQHAIEGGPIHLQPRQWNSTPGPTTYTFTRASFITLFADIAHVGIMRTHVIQQIKGIVVGRLLEDLNDQLQFVIPEREVIAGVLLGFKNVDRRGVIISRVMDIADEIAASGVAYRFVPKDQQTAFDRLTEMSEGGAFTRAPQIQKGLVNVRYGDAIYTAPVEHYVWFFIRFVLDDIDLGGKMLDFATWQLQLDAINTVVKALDAAGAAGPDGLTLGDFYARGPGLDIVKHARGISQKPSTTGPDFCTLVVSPKEARKLAELQEWLAARAQDLRNKIGKSTSLH